MKLLAKTALLLLVSASSAFAQVNAGEQKPEAALPFEMTQVATFNLPWRIAFLPDGRMLITEKVGPVWLVTQQGQKMIVGNTPPVYWQNQNGMLGVYLSPKYATDQSIYLTYVEPGDYGGGLALARARLNITNNPRLEKFEVIWRQLPRGKGGQPGGGGIRDGRAPARVASHQLGVAADDADPQWCIHGSLLVSML